MVATRISIEDLIKIVRNGGRIKTGVDVYNTEGLLLLDKDIIVDKVKPLEIIRDKGIDSLPLHSGLESGIWDAQGNHISIKQDGTIGIQQKDAPGRPADFNSLTGPIEKRLKEIEELKAIATEKYDGAKNTIKKVLGEIRESGGEFDYDDVETNVSDLVEFLTITDNPFSYLTKEIFSYDDYLYNHSINVCAIGTAVLNRFNKNFSTVINQHLNAGDSMDYNPFARKGSSEKDSYKCYHSEELQEISIGFFLHDIGKVMVPDEILNKSDKLTSTEFDLIKRHSYEFGIDLLQKNRLKNSFVRSIVKNHHAPIYQGEERCYPEDKHYSDIPIHVKICKLADIYDAMTSKRSYKEAFNQINVVTEIFRKYAKKDPILQYVLHSFVKSIGIYPPGSIVYLRNGQMAYVLESSGPLVIAFTDTRGNTLREKPDPMDMSSSLTQEEFKVDNRKSIKTPLEVYDLLPSYLKPRTN